MGRLNVAISLLASRGGNPQPNASSVVSSLALSCFLLLCLCACAAASVAVPVAAEEEKEPRIMRQRSYPSQWLDEVDCPAFCHCFENLDTQFLSLTVDCRNAELREVPSPLSFLTTHLDLSGNSLQVIRATDFAGLGHLRFLQLQNNELTEVEMGAFRHLQSLQTLTLFNNRIEHFPEGFFRGLHNLKQLDAYHMRLMTFDANVFQDLESVVEIDLSFNDLESIAAGSFSGLDDLETLSLNDNHIKTIERGSINNLPSLLYLNLASNQLATIPTRGFNKLPSVLTVVLQSNPIVCDCDSVWLQNWLIKKKMMGPNCTAPANLRDEQLVRLSVDEICKVPETVLLFRDVAVATGQELILTCNVSGAPPPEVTWAKDGMTLDLSGNGRLTAESSSAGDGDRSEVLRVGDVREGDGGEYSCIAASSAGTVATGTRVTVLNLTAEGLLVTLALLGETLALPCSPGLPHSIPVQWHFNGMALQMTSRYFIAEDSSLIVVEAGLGQEGDYVCQVVGTANLTRTLELLSPPIITSIPQGSNCLRPHVVEKDFTDKTPLVCEVFSLPPPTSVTWIPERVLMPGLFSSVPTPCPNSTVKASMFFFAQFPSLSIPPLEATGNYTCVATNALGTISQTISLDIIITVPVNTTSPVVFETITLFVGENLELPCDVETEGTEFTLTWETEEGFPLPEMSFVTNESSLVLVNVSLDDTATYLCTVERTDMDGKVILEHTVFVVEAPSIAKECALPRRVHLVGDLVRLPCRITAGSPTISIIWTKDGTPIEEAFQSNQFDLLMDGEELVILRADDEDGGVYVCQASNQHGNDSFAIQLEVLRRPYFTHMPVRTYVTVLEQAQLQCSGRGNPPPLLSWWRLSANLTAVQVEESGRVVIGSEYLVFLATQVRMWAVKEFSLAKG